MLKQVVHVLVVISAVQKFILATTVSGLDSARCPNSVQGVPKFVVQ